MARPAVTDGPGLGCTTLSFFEPRPPRRPEPEPEPREPEWYGPPPGVIGGVSTMRVTLARTADVAVVAHRFLAFPTGVEFTRQFWTAEARSAHHRPHGLFAPPDQMADGDLRFGVQYPDGSKWTSESMWMPRDAEERPSSPLVVPRSGGGGAHSWRQGFWMWPLPESGTLTFVLEWPDREIEERAVSVDTTDLRRAALEAEELWV